MKRQVCAWLLGASLLWGCLVVPGPHGPEVVVPRLPPIVELVDPFYFYGGFYYYYHDDRWSYGRSRSGPWTDLPRGHYPRETRWKGRGGGRDRDR